MGWVAVAPAGQVPEGTLKVFRLGDRRVAVSRVGGTFYAMDDLCTHDEGPLGEGTLEGTAVECPRHGARFDVTTGAALSMPAVTPVRVHAVRVADGRLEISLSE
jgi:3-phenylpropionate/trans-cinnamate dioxygenase ferredoxin subunit